jgi:tRNA (guanine37-N1)-methyltransferase
MNFHILTLFPDMIVQGLSHSIIARAQKSGLINLNCVNIRDFATNKHNHVDDTPYGGGAGMVMQAQPIDDAYASIKASVSKGTRVIYMTPQGKVFNQQIAKELACEKDLIILCGHYEGVDERIIEEIVTDEVSIGDFVLTGGELGAMIVIDAVSRLIPGVLGKEESFQDESFSNNLLEYPQYTKPAVFKDREVPDILLSGHHANIAKWRHEQSLIRTYHKRPDLLNSIEMTDKDKKFIEAYKNSVNKK